MPGTAAALLEQLGQPLPASERFGVAPAGNVNAEEGVWECLATGSVSAAASNLCPRLEIPEEMKEDKKAKQKKPAKEKEAKAVPASAPAEMSVPGEMCIRDRYARAVLSPFRREGERHHDQRSGHGL